MKGSNYCPVIHLEVFAGFIYEHLSNDDKRKIQDRMCRILGSATTQSKLGLAAIALLVDSDYKADNEFWTAQYKRFPENLFYILDGVALNGPDNII